MRYLLLAAILVIAGCDEPGGIFDPLGKSENPVSSTGPPPPPTPLPATPVGVTRYEATTAMSVYGVGSFDIPYHIGGTDPDTLLASYRVYILHTDTDTPTWVPVVGDAGLASTTARFIVGRWWITVDHDRGQHQPIDTARIVVEYNQWH